MSHIRDQRNAPGDGSKSLQELSVELNGEPLPPPSPEAIAEAKARKRERDMRNAAGLDKLNPDLTLDLERLWHFLHTDPNHEDLTRLKAALMRQYRLGKEHGFEGAARAIREHKHGS
jgi:hypothetical protein